MKPWKEIMDETMWCWKRLLRVPWTTRKSNQSTRKKINAEYSLEGLMLKLKCQYFDYLLWRAYSLEKTLILERLKAGGEGTTEDEMVGWYHQLNGHEFEQTTGVSEGQGILECWSSWGCKESGHDLATEQKQEMKSWKEKSARWCLDLQWFSEERHG